MPLKHRRGPRREKTKPRVVVITGASAGVGRAAARLFARRGDKVALLARGRDGLKAAAREVELAGGQALPIKVDVADAEEVEQAAEEVERKLGPIDVWVNNAMATVFGAVKQASAEEFHRVTEVTYLGSVYGTKAALKHMLPRNRGVIVQVSSALGVRSIPLQAPYCGAKHAIAGFLESLRSELLHDKSQVQITEVLLPAVNTPQFGWARNHLSHRPRPLAPIYAPEVAARAIVWASDHPRRRIEVGAPTVAIAFAQKLIPGLLDRYMAASAYRGQQIEHEPENGRHRDNLFAPVGGDHGTQGRFGAQSWRRSPGLWLNTHRSWLMMVAGTGALWWAARRALR
jgi:short-subunit dehydrogenase